MCTACCGLCQPRAKRRIDKQRLGALNKLIRRLEEQPYSIAVP